MPPPDSSCEVINAKSGHKRSNSSWVIGRCVRDYGTWMDPAASKKLQEVLDAKFRKDNDRYTEMHGAGHGDKTGSDSLHPPRPQYPTKAGLVVSVYEAEDARAGTSGRDAIYWLGFAATIVQLGIAAVPLALWGDWAIFLVTVAGILLSFLTGSLPQWRAEKWACRQRSAKDVILTTGNGSQHAILILGQGRGFDLEDLAAAGQNVMVGSSASKNNRRISTLNSATLTRTALILLATLWIMLLIVAAGITANTWFLLAIGGIGTLQNVLVAGRARTPAAFGMPLRFREAIGQVKVMETLYAVEERYPRAGANMLDTFMPAGKLREEERRMWEQFAGRVGEGT